MKLTILGSGTIIPTIKRNSPGYFLNIGSENILVDCGAGVLNQMIKAKIDFNRLDYIFISHRHTDHIAELITILNAMFVLREYYKKPAKKITIVGYQGFIKDYQHLRQASFKLGREKYSVKVSELVNKSKKFGQWLVRSQEVLHGKLHCNAYRFEYQKKSLVFGSDGYYGPRLLKISKKADLAVYDCSVPIQKSSAAHMSPAECGQAAAEAGVKKLILSHISLSAENYNLVEQTKKYYRGPIVAAKDLMKLKI